MCDADATHERRRRDFRGMKTSSPRCRIKASNARRDDGRLGRIKTNKRNGRSLFSSSADCDGKIEAYFAQHLAESGDVADIESLADYLGSTRDELMALMSDKRYGKTLRKARNRIAMIKKQLAFRGKIPATVLSFDLKNNHGYRDKPEESETNTEQVVFKGQTDEWAK